ncbi:MAG: hypothetical protein IPL61_05755 [Myxococcales bacterium]|nr:hypothetical protein [Myxococcales bacterium]
MLLVWGTRSYGRVDGFGGQFAATRFFHVWFMPLIPLGSTWVTEDLGEHARGHAIRLSGKSLAAAYLRTWGLLGGAIAALVGVATGALVPIAVGAAVAGGGVTSWRWRTARGVGARRASLLLATLPTACDPVRMRRGLAEQLRIDAEARWAAVADGRTPGDLIERGDATPPQRAAAFTLLRVLARAQRGATGRAARRDSERLLDAPPAAQVGGPYRDQLPAP